MANLDQRMFFQWNDFRENVSSAFGDLREDTEFTDVTLACDDGQQVEAHKVVLFASSPFFLNILKRSRHSHALIYMRGVKSENLLAMVDFFYHGEANVSQENVDSFLALAEELQLKGLRGNQTEKENSEMFTLTAMKKEQSKLPTSRAEPKQTLKNNEARIESEILKPKTEKVVALTDHTTNNTDIKSLDQEVKSMMIFSDNAAPGSVAGRARICKVCGMEGSMKNIMNHIEANHIDGISIPCDICRKSCKSRSALATHKSTYHRNGYIYCKAQLKQDH
jgi:hypothetical protein